MEKAGNKGEFSFERTDRIAGLVDRCAEEISARIGSLPALAIVLGSGFQQVTYAMRTLSEMSYDELPGFVCPQVEGHAGKLICGELGGVKAVLCSGRTHFYEGHPIDAVTFPIRVLARCGVKDLLLTNAAGGINARYKAGEFMAFTDHINFTGVNPLRGMPTDEGQCFVDLSDTYSTQLRSYLRAAGKIVSMQVHEGVYIGVSGPAYETPAEIRAFRKWGADAVGMSTVAEAIMARYCKMEVAGLSCITNAAAGLTATKLSHGEVLKAGKASGEKACKLLKAFALEYDKDSGMSRSGKNRSLSARERI